MKPIAKALLIVAILNVFVPWFALWLVAGRDLVHEAHWKGRIEKAHAEAFTIGQFAPDDPKLRKQNEEEISDIFSQIVESRRHATWIIECILYYSWGTALILAACAYFLTRKKKTPNQSLVPTTTAVTPPAAQESRQPRSRHT
jgi:hypothetical protein